MRIAGRRMRARVYKLSDGWYWRCLSPCARGGDKVRTFDGAVEELLIHFREHRVFGFQTGRKK